MPSYKHKSNAGALFKNNRKETDNQPDYKGQLNVEGKMFWLNAWLNTSQTGEKYMAIRLQPQEAKQEQPQQEKLKVVGGSDVDPNDEIPF